MAALACRPCRRSFVDGQALGQHLRNSPIHAATFDCDSCARVLNSEQALQQHLRNTPAHTIRVFDCDVCDREFDTEHALQQHLRDSPAHAITFSCDECNRQFNSGEALEQHLRHSPAHAITFDCNDCNRAFTTEEGLEQHLRDSPAHTITFDFEECDRAFRTKEGLAQHLRDSPAHATTFDCDECNRAFITQEGLEQHLRYATIHKNRNRASSSRRTPAQRRQHLPTQTFTFDSDRTFGSLDALTQHFQHLSTRNVTIDCDDWDRAFDDQHGLEQNLRYSPAHNIPFLYDRCERAVGTQEALRQDLFNSSARDVWSDCDKCDDSVSTESTLEKFLHNSSAQPVTSVIQCDERDQAFHTEDNLEIHSCQSSAYSTAPSFASHDDGQHIKFEPLDELLLDALVHAVTPDDGASSNPLNTNPAQQQNTRDDLPDDSPNTTCLEGTYKGVHSSEIQPVFELACKLKDLKPKAIQIISESGTNLEPRIVSALIQGALRLRAQPSNPKDIAASRKKMRTKQKRARQAEANFVAKVKTKEANLVDEVHQRLIIQSAKSIEAVASADALEDNKVTEDVESAKDTDPSEDTSLFEELESAKSPCSSEEIEVIDNIATLERVKATELASPNKVIVATMTPDILFPGPTMIHGVSCHWIEYKSGFGFKSDPFVFQRSLKQVKKYAEVFGSGMVVYKLGFEMGLFNIEGVTCVREAEVFERIDELRASA